MAAPSDDKSLALYCDFENIALGVRDAKYQKFDIHHILERLLVKGSIVVKKAYCDWDRYKNFKGPMHEAAFELIEIPHVRMSGKNSADIRMVVDALDLCYTKSHVDTFVIISGDSDFSPLVHKLRENAKTVIGVGVKNSTSDLLISSCDEFIYYDDLVREIEKKAPRAKRASKKRASRAKSTDKDDARGEAKAGDKADDKASDKEDAKGDDKATTSGKGTVPGKAPAADNADATHGSVSLADAAHANADVAADSEAPKKKSASRSRRGGRRSKTEVALGEAPVDATIVDIADGKPLDDSAANDVQANGQQDLQGDDGDDDGEDSTPEDLAQEGLDVLLETALAMSTERGGSDKLWGSMVKQTLKRRRPGFNESYYGYDSFGRMLEEAAERGYLVLEHDDRSGGYIITRITL